MKAAIYTKYGPPEVLEVKDVDKPIPGHNEVLIKVHYASVNRSDTGFRSAHYVVSRFFTGLLKPKYQIPGTEFAGEIIAIGEGVKSYRVGDQVFGFDDVHAGANAEYLTKPEDGPFTVIPKGFDYKQVASASEGATYALNVINALNIRAGQNVMVYGASGAIGSAAVQILKHRGARVTAVCVTSAIKQVRSLKPDRIIDYQKEDFTKDGTVYDLVFDAVGKRSYGACKKLLTKNGTYYSSELGKAGQNVWLALYFNVTGRKRVIFPIPKITKTVIEEIRDLIKAGAYLPLIDRIYSLDDIVEATRYVESGQKIGTVLIDLE